MTQQAAAGGEAWLGLAGQVCVVTGGGSGIGAETARQFAAAGGLVAVVDRNAGPAEQVAAGIVAAGGRAIGIEADVGRPEMIEAAAQRVQRELGPCRILVNNAAVRHAADRLVDLSLDDWNRVLAVNLTGALLCTQAFSRQMIAAGQGGSIVHVASVQAHHPATGAGAYAVSKAGLILMSRLLAVELGPQRIRSNVVSPGFTRTPHTEAAYAHAETAAARERMIPVGRVASAADMAQVIVFLASERGGYIDGQDVLVDGGFGNVLLSLAPRAPAQPAKG